MATQLDLILQYAENQLGSSRWHGKCQAFVALCYEAGTGVFISCNSAKISRQRYMKSGTASDLYPPAGAAVYFNGDGEAGKKYGHVALSAGGGILYDPVSTVYKCRLTSSMHNGYLGWGWLGSRPEGATDASAQNTAANAASTAAGTSSSAKKEITTVLVKASSGQTGVRTGEFAAEIKARDKVNVFIQNGDAVYAPVVVDEVQLTYARDAASVLRFSVVEDGILQLENGCPVAFRYDGKPLFYGYVFEIKRKTGAATQVTCYDQLRYLQNLKERYGCKVGLSNHSIGHTLDVAATALGADMIEKHFARDRNSGIDAAFSMTPDELKALKEATALTAQTMGYQAIVLSETDQQGRKGRRSVYLVKDLAQGETLTYEHVRIIRPGHGLEPYRLNEVLGKKARHALTAPLPLDAADFA